MRIGASFKRGVLALALIGAIGASWWWLGHRRFETTDNAYLKADSAVIAPRVEGYVARINVRENQRVREGEPLVVLDRRNYAARLAEATAMTSAKSAQVAGDEAALTSLDAQIRQQSSVVAQMGASLEVARAEAERASLDFQRYKSLAATNVASTQRLESVTSDNLKAGAELRKARAVLDAEQLRIPVLEGDRRKAEARLQQSHAELAQAQAARALAEIDVQDTEIRAPFDGVLGNLSARVGQYVRPGSVLLTVVPENVYLVANFKETQVSAMRPGQCVTLTIDALPNLRLDGRLESFAPATGAAFSILPPENATGNFTKIVQRVPVRIRIATPPEIRNRLTSGLSAIVSVDTADQSESSADACASGPRSRVPRPSTSPGPLISRIETEK